MWLTSCCSMSLCRDKDGAAAAESPSAVAPGGRPVVLSPPSGGAPSANDLQQSPVSPQAVRQEDRVPLKAPTPNVLNLPVVKGRSSDKLDSQDAASVAGSNKHSSRSAYSNVSSIGSEFINEHIPEHKKQVALIQSQMKAFVKGMVKGRDMSVLSVDGQLRTCTCSFDRKLRNYNILISKETRAIPLAKFREVFEGLEPEDIATPLDELCCTFVLENGECLTFRFKDVEERTNFAKCLQIIVDGHQ
mmetsp:Transcript_153513/g.492022  ORF Transcript_153513/g.492022 Transcript_153513/m.492022 type:complete len:246 (+) Transcript_153513:157-894(+)